MVRSDEIKVISELGVFLLVIIAGLEINIQEMVKSQKGKNIVISILAFILPATSGFFVGNLFGLPTVTCFFIGLCVAITALPVSVRILMDLGRLKSDVGQRMISVAIFDDVLALTLLGVLLDLHNMEGASYQAIGLQVGLTLGKVVLLIIGLVLAYRAVNFLTQQENFVEHQLDKLLLLMRGKEPLLAILFAFILIFASLTEGAGLHFIIGAFFASLLLSKELIGPKNMASFEKTTHGMAMGFLAPIFFAGVGLEFQIGAI